jgi:hypothetical protein
MIQFAQTFVLALKNTAWLVGEANGEGGENGSALGRTGKEERAQCRSQIIECLKTLQPPHENRRSQKRGKKVPLKIDGSALVI